MFGCAGGPDLDVLPTDTLLCANAQYELSPDTGSSAGHQYAWNTGDTSQSIIADSSRSYQVSVTDTATGCCSVRCAEIGIVHIPDPGLYDDTICELGGPSSGSFFSAACLNCVSIWNGVDTNNIIYNYTEEGIVTNRVIDTVVGCFEDDTALIIMEDAPLEFFPSRSNEICLGDTITLSATSGYVSYSWSEFLDPGWVPLSDSSAISLVSSGQYRLLVSTEFGCQAIDTASLIVNPNPFPVIQDVWQGDSFILFTSEHYDVYLWSNGGVDSSMSPDSNGIYSVVVIDSNGCSSSDEIDIINLSVSEGASTQVNVFPNPANQAVYLHLNDNDPKVLIRLTDLAGGILFQEFMDSGIRAINLQDFPSGTYLIHVISTKSSQVKTLVVNH